jgi:GT2 family glycosyltransferase
VENTFVIPVIRTDLIARCLATLYARTPPGFLVYLVDQTADGLPVEDLRRQYENLLIVRTPRTATHASGNLGFAKAVNLGLALVETRFATICNDDVEFINPAWWDGVLATFERFAGPTTRRPPAMVTPTSVKLPHWAIGRPPGQDHYVLDYRSEWSEADWTFLVGEEHPVNDRLTIRPHTVSQAAEMFCSVVAMDRFRAIGPLNERFYPGGGEDYDYCRRANLHGFACLGTTDSWVYHHWGATRNLVRRGEIPLDHQLRWNDLGALWPRDRSLSLDELPEPTRRPL